MSDRRGVLDTLRARGEEVVNRVSLELMGNAHFMKALQTAMQGKQVFDQAAARALKQMNIPTRTEFKKALKRIEALEAELAALKAKPKPAPRRRASAGAAAPSAAKQTAE